MRIAIREQLALVVLACSLVSIAVISIASWVVNHNYVVQVKQGSLSLTAALYAAQLDSALAIIQAGVGSISTRILIQQSLQRYYQGNVSDANWVRAQSDLMTAMNGGGSYEYLLQAVVQSRNETHAPGNNTLLRATASNVFSENITLPYSINGSAVVLGQDNGGGYPNHLYPNLTYSTQQLPNGTNATTTFWNGTELGVDSALLLGPWILNQTYSLLSVTLPILNSSQPGDILGWLTVISNGELINDVVTSTEGMGQTGVLLLVGPGGQQNTFKPGILYDDPTQSSLSANADDPIRFVVPPFQSQNRSLRHPGYASASATDNGTVAFSLSSYPAVESALEVTQDKDFNAGSMLDTHNEEGDHVAVGYALLQNDIVNWVVLIEEAYWEVEAPLIYLRNVLISCLFGTLGAVLLIAFPAAHYFVRPIRRLREATTRSVEGSAGTSDKSSIRTGMSLPFTENAVNEKQPASSSRLPSWRKVWTLIRRPSWQERHSRRGSFRIPKKVPDPKHYIFDELTDLTATFNEMVDELNLQYNKLEERVRERTAELELSKKAAEAANEAKTLFIANISHELKTPLNGILGMCAVSMYETDLPKVKRSLGIIHKSGDLLLHLLTDLLTFSKNQVGHEVKLEEREFRLAEVSTQVLSIFEQQAREGMIDLRVEFAEPDEDILPSDGVGVPIYGPHGTGKVKDMLLWGDQHRVLQVVINLVSNSLKFTPKGGRVHVRIKCLGMLAEDEESGRPSRNNSRHSRNSRPMGRGRQRDSSSGSGSVGSTDLRMPALEPSSSNLSTAIEINSFDPPERRSAAKRMKSTDVRIRDVSPSPPPHAARQLVFEFSVEDTGPGIHPDQQEKIFEPFVQGDLGLSKKFGGTGLGLSICQQLAKLMRGGVTLESDPGKGSKFMMRIPLRFVKARSGSISSMRLDGSRRHSLQLNKGIPDSPDALELAQKKDAKRKSVPPLHVPKAAHLQGSVLDSPTDSPVNDSDVSVSEISTHSAPAHRRNSAPANQPRLVGLSQPYFATNGTKGEEEGQEETKPRLEPMKRATIEASAASSPRVRVLVAEDNKVNQEVVQRMLKLEDISDVTIARDGQEAFDFVKASLDPGTPDRQNFDLIFMDVQMPNVDGLQSTRLIRGVGFSAPIVALTAFSEESNMQECMESGMDYFLPKPIRRPALRQVLRKFCPTIPEEDESAVKTVTAKADKKSKDKGKENQDEEKFAAGVDLNVRRGSSASKRPLLVSVSSPTTAISVTGANGTVGSPAPPASPIVAATPH